MSSWSVIAAGATALVLMLPLTAVAAAAVTPGGRAPEHVCADLAARQEQARGIPPGLVRAVALAESGRWLASARTTRAWPWTITSGPDNFFLDSKAAALAKVRELRAAGRSNIDVGCMQINLAYHGDAFASVDEALEPATNVAYGAQFLHDLRHETRSWARATARYHSRDPARGKAYRERVYRLWYEVRRGRLGEVAPSGRPPLVIREARGQLIDRTPRRLVIPAIQPNGRLAETPGAPGGIALLRGRRSLPAAPAALSGKGAH